MPYQLVCVFAFVFVFAMLLIEKILRGFEAKEGQVFSREEIRWRKRIAIVVGFAIFLGLWFYLAVGHEYSLSPFGL